MCIHQKTYVGVNEHVQDALNTIGEYQNIVSFAHRKAQRSIDPNVHAALVQDATARLWASVWLGGCLMVFWWLPK